MFLWSILIVGLMDSFRGRQLREGVALRDRGLWLMMSLTFLFPIGRKGG